MTVNNFGVQTLVQALRVGLDGMIAYLPFAPVKFLHCRQTIIQLLKGEISLKHLHCFVLVVGQSATRH